jgi:integrase
MNLPEWSALSNMLDRGVSLTPLEQYALSQWVSRPPTIGKRYERDRKQEFQYLERLIRPIKAVFAHCNHPDEVGRNSYACCVLLLKEMYVRQTTLWAWDTTLWLETIGVTQQDYAHRQGVIHGERQLPQANLRHQLISCAYLLGGVTIHRFITDCNLSASARSIFGRKRVNGARYAVADKLAEAGVNYLNIPGLRVCTAWALLLNRSCMLEELTLDVMEEVYQLSAPSKGMQQGCLAVVQALQLAGILSQPLAAAPVPKPPRERPRPKPQDTLPVAWKEMIEEWSKLTYGQERTVASQRSRIAKAGRWTTAVFPKANNPAQWTASIAKAFVEAVCTMKVGDWNRDQIPRKGTRWGEELRAAVRVQIINAVRCFFTECQAAKLLPDAFDPAIFLRTPPDLLAACGPNPQVIQWDIWKRLEQAGLSLTQADLPRPTELPKGYHVEATYPLEMVRALAAVWLFAGLRRDEIVRLPIGCIRWLPATQHSDRSSAKRARRIVNLRVPANKSSGPFDKAVDTRLARALDAWERCLRLLLSPKERRRGLLFVWRGRPLSVNYINQVLIPLLCRKAGISNYDARGRITCHRGRATLATQLYQAGVPRRHVQQWLGHQFARSTDYYLRYDEEIVPETVRSAFQAMHVPHLSPLMPVPPISTPTTPTCEEPVALTGMLAHLRFQPHETIQSLALTARNSLSQVQEQLSLTAAERHALVHAMELLGTIAIRM